MRVGSQTPRVSQYPAYKTTAATEVIELAASAGLPLDPWQQYVLTHGLGELAGGNWAAFKVACWVARQNGKGGIIEALELAWLFLFGEKLILHSAHEYKTAQEAFLRVKGLVENTPHLDRLVNRYWQANGEQGIELVKKAGSRRLRFVARSRTSGRGFSGTKNVLDEAQELTGQQMAALLPTMSAQPNAQVWFFGTPPEDSTAWCYALKEDGEAAAPRFAWFDWGADLDLSNPMDRARLDDRDLWYECNPALGIRISEDFVEDERKPSGLGDGFARERLGLWPPKDSGKSIIDPHVWGSLADRKSRRVTGAGVAFAVDITPGRDAASIAAVGPRKDGLLHAELIEHRQGTEWLLARLVTLIERHNPVAVGLDLRGPAGTLYTDLEKAGITKPTDSDKPKRGDLAIPTGMEVAAACGQLLDAVNQGTLRHIDQPPLNIAIAGAKTRQLGDSWGWARRIATVDISPLVALTMARWAWETRAHLVTDTYDPLANLW